MNATQKLHDAGQRIWLDNITRSLLSSGTLQRYIDEFSVTGLTSNPTIFDQAIESTGSYDEAIRAKRSQGKSGEALFLELALEDLTRAADLFRLVHERSGGLDGWVSLEVSPLLAHDAGRSRQEARRLHDLAGRDNLFIKIPGTVQGLAAIADTIADGIPVNVTLLFSREQYVAAADAYMDGIERRLSAGLDPRVDSVASLFVSRWDKAVSGRVPPELRNRLGIAVAQGTYQAYRELLASPRWQSLAAAGARVQRLLWASTGTKDPDAPDTLYIDALAAPDTINTMPDKTLLAFADHGKVDRMLSPDGGGSTRVLEEFTRFGIDPAALAFELQREGAAAFSKSWNALLDRLASRSEAVGAH